MQISIRPDVIVTLSVIGILVFMPLLFAALPLRTRFASKTASISLGVSGALLVFTAFLFDMLLGVSALWSFSLGVWVIGAISCVVVWARYRSRFAPVVLSLITIFTLIQHMLDFSPVKPYKRFFAAIQPGMTESEILQALDREFPAGGVFPVPVRNDFRTNEISFALDPEESVWNAEAIVIRLDSNRVITKQYWRD